MLEGLADGLAVEPAPLGGNRGPITTYLTIEQTYWTLHATLRTAESMSRSNNATIVKTDGSGIAEVAGSPGAAGPGRRPARACRYPAPTA
ncbi:hypothetical protein ACWEQL_03765 [Kitasatospora sp. NPDC004240]